MTLKVALYIQMCPFPRGKIVLVCKGQKEPSSINRGSPLFRGSLLRSRGVKGVHIMRTFRLYGNCGYSKLDLPW